MISWEATISHGMPIEDFTALFEFDNKRSKFLRDITQHTIKFLREVLNREMSFAADPLAMAVLMEPEMLKKLLSGMSRLSGRRIEPWHDRHRLVGHVQEAS